MGRALWQWRIESSNFFAAAGGEGIFGFVKMAAIEPKYDISKSSSPAIYCHTPTSILSRGSQPGALVV